MKAILGTDEEAVDLRACFDEMAEGGYITHAQLKKVMQADNENVSDAEIAKMIKDADSDSDGKVDYDEFVAMMEQITL